MIITNKEEFLLNKEDFLDKIRKGAVFIYPTDTIYGLGCSALDCKAVMKLRDIKGRHTAPYAVIAPTEKWVRKNCNVDKNVEEWLKKLPGPYTLIVELENEKAVCDPVLKGIDTIGVRIPKHWFSEMVEELGMPIVTTSVNKTDSPFMTSLDDLDHDIRSAVDFVIDVGELKGKPSMIVHLYDEQVRIVEREHHTH